MTTTIKQLVCSNELISFLKFSIIFLKRSTSSGLSWYFWVIVTLPEFVKLLSKSACSSAFSLAFCAKFALPSMLFLKLSSRSCLASSVCHQLLLSGETQYQSNLSSYLVSSWSKSLSISGGDSSCSWVLVRALGLIVKEEFKSVMLGGGWRCGELLVSSSTFAVIQRIRKSVPPQKHPHWKNTNTQLQYSLYCYSLDWWW